MVAGLAVDLTRFTAVPTASVEILRAAAPRARRKSPTALSNVVPWRVERAASSRRAFIASRLARTSLWNWALLLAMPVQNKSAQLAPHATEEEATPGRRGSGWSARPCTSCRWPSRGAAAPSLRDRARTPWSPRRRPRPTPCEARRSWSPTLVAQGRESAESSLSSGEPCVSTADRSAPEERDRWVRASVDTRPSLCSGESSLKRGLSRPTCWARVLQRAPNARHRDAW